MKITVLTGAGVSADSGIRTFRDSNGLWEGHDVMEVASPEGWRKNPALVLDFYNQRRKQLDEVEPNAAHQALKDLEKHFQVSIVTQNVDDLHERAGSTDIIHVHGELRYARSTRDPSYRVRIDGNAIGLGQICPKGGQLRPDIVWFGEGVPKIHPAMEKVEDADILLIVGTSLEVHPAASLRDYYRGHLPIYVIDLSRHSNLPSSRYEIINERASVAMPVLAQKLIKLYAKG